MSEIRYSPEAITGGAVEMETERAVLMENFKTFFQNKNLEKKEIIEDKLGDIPQITIKENGKQVAFFGSKYKGGVFVEKGDLGEEFVNSLDEKKYLIEYPDTGWKLTLKQK